MTNNNNRLKTYKEIFSMTAKDFQDLLKQNTDINYHTENVLYLAFRSGNKKFIEEAKLVLADHLTRQGIAVLRFDDRGVGKSTGNFSLVIS